MTTTKTSSKEAIKAQIAKLQEELKAAEQAERKEALQTVKDLCRKHNFTVAMLGTAIQDHRKTEASNDDEKGGK